MEPGFIQLFCSDHIAIFRPNKRTYSILQYRHNKWVKFRLDPAFASSIVRSRQDIPLAQVKISIDAGALIICKATGQYLVYNNTIITVIEKMRNSVRNFPQSMYSGEITVDTQVVRENNEPLWTLFPIAPVPVAVSVSVHMPVPIPQRIAWIIAEDASKKDQDCPITLNRISPLTASVTSCFHVFETESILQAIETNASCPVCRTKNPTVTACFTS